MRFAPAAAAVVLLSTLSAAAQTRPRAATPHRAAAATPALAPTGATVLLDTSDGRLTCRLFEKEAPTGTARFLDLARAGRYDGAILIGITDGIGADVPAGSAPAATPFAPDHNTLSPTQPGILGLTVSKGEVAGSRFVVLEHPDAEYEKRVAPIGQCDSPSLRKAESISHKLLLVANRPPVPVVLNKVLVAAPGAALPPETPAGTPPTLTYPPEPGSEIPAPEPTGPSASIETTLGTLHCRLFNETPKATSNFIGLATGTRDFKMPKTGATVHGKPYYNGLHLARVIPDFMVQQSDMPGDPTGDLSIGFQFSNEIVPGLNFDRPGRLAYANSGPDTNSAEWFVTETPQPRLNGKYTIFGQCDAASQAVVAAIARTPRDAHNRPLTPVTVRSIRIER